VIEELNYGDHWQEYGERSESQDQEPALTAPYRQRHTPAKSCHGGRSGRPLPGWTSDPGAPPTAAAVAISERSEWPEFADYEISCLGCV